MSASQRALLFDDAEQTLTVLGAFLGKFAECWEVSDEPPPLEEFLPEEPELRRFTLIELIKIDLEYRWLQRQVPKRIEEYVQEFPELAEGGVPPDLIYEEFHIRKQSGLQADPQEYLDRFPAQAEELRCMLGIKAEVSTSLYRRESKKKTLDAFDAGQQLDDFDLLARLGQGAFARVFLARQRSMQRLVALKISADEGTEPQTLAQLDHDSIVRVFDQRVTPDIGLRLLYMQYVAGGTLQAVVQAVRETPPAERSGRLLFETLAAALEARGESQPAESALREKLEPAPWTEVVCWIGARLAAALDYAHRRGVLHRDVKPANVLVTGEGAPKLADFNISFASSLAGVTPAAFFGGSLAYMSPEQLEATNPAHERQPDSLDGRSDLYSLGVMLWELLTGKRPFTDDEFQGGWSNTLNAMAVRRRAGPDEAAFSELPADCPPELVRVLLKCLAADPQDRWQSGAELAKHLELCLKPEALDLLHPPERSWRKRLRPAAVPIIFVAAAVPNVLAGVFNYHYNEAAIISHKENFQDVFANVQFVINAIAYPLGLGLMAGLTYTVARGLQYRRREGRVNGDSLKRLRYRCLHLGHFAAVISVVLWTIAGLAYPVSLHWVAGTMSVQGYVHFFASLVLCGLIAATYPFFAATYFSLRVLYPGLLGDGLPASEDLAVLKRLKWLTGGYLALAALVPSLSVLALVVLRQEHTEVERFALQVVGLVGFFGFLLIFFWFHRGLQADLEALTEVVTAE